MRLLGIAGIASAALLGAGGAVTLGHAAGVHSSTHSRALVRPAAPPAGRCSSVGRGDEVTVANLATARTEGVSTPCDGRQGASVR
jgi:hypothetical protein